MTEKRMTVELVITAFSALAGGAIGAWLSATFDRRRERWNLRRNLYERLLEHIGEAHYDLNVLWNAEQEGRAVTDEWRESWLGSARSAFGEARRVMTVGRLMLKKETVDILDRLFIEWDKADSKVFYSEMLFDQLDSVAVAYKMLLHAAQADLGIAPRKGWRIWLRDS